MSLSFPADTFDAATMALVIYFTPEPIKGVVEMARVVRPGGSGRICLGHVGRWISFGAAPYRNACDGPYGSKSTELRSIADRGTTRLVDQRWYRCGRNERHHRAKNLR